MFDMTMTHRVTAGCVAVAIILACQFPVHADCPNGWKSGGGLPGVDGQVMAATGWDPDGPGPMEEMLIVGGSFAASGGVFSNSIAAWDGHRWQSLGGGMTWPWPSESRVYSLLVFNGKLIAGGSFSRAGYVDARSVASWDGIRWRALGEGLPGLVLSLCEYNGELFAGTYEDIADPRGCVFRWDGSSWHPVAYTEGRDHGVLALCVFNGELIASGTLNVIEGLEVTGVARWDGTTWRALQGEISGSYGAALALEVFDGSLYAGGVFDSVDGVLCPGIARWDGESWHGLGTESFSLWLVFALKSVGDRLIVGGYFDADSESNTPTVCAWDGEGWSRLGEGGDLETTAICSYRDEIVVGGWSFGNSLPYTWGVAHFDGSDWVSFCDGLNDYVTAMTTYEDSVVFGGPFTAAGGKRVHSIVKRSGDEWQSLGQGFSMECVSGVETNGGCTLSVNALRVFEDDLIAAGRFDLADGVRVKGIARWDGAAWKPMGSGFSGTVHALTEHEGKLYAGGVFWSSGGTTVRCVAQWDGAGWIPLGSGLGGPYPRVYALLSYEGKLIVGGYQLFGSSSDRISIAEWDGVNWTPIKLNMIGEPVYRLAEFQGELIAAGSIGVQGLSGPTPFILKRQEDSWQVFEGGITSILSNPVSMLNTVGDRLIVGGFFSSAGGVPVRNVAQWDGARWSQFGDGRADPVAAIEFVGQDIICATGIYDSAEQFVSIGYATWGPVGPVFHSEPASVSACPATMATLAAEVEVVGSADYQWFRDGVTLVDDGRYSGATTQTLTIAAADLDDEGLYWLRASDDCGTTQSAPALVNIPCCGARADGDLNNDGVTNGLDLQYFLDRMLSGSRAASVVCGADFNYDRILDAQDAHALAELLIH